jgi:glycosyltransferase involved in cell wall biosynthesis
MQILFVHPNFPGQFGPILPWLAKRHGVECVFVSEKAEGVRDGVRCIRFVKRGGATQANHFCSRTFENGVWAAHAVYEACKAAKDLQPDLIVAHGGFGTTVFLRELYTCPIIHQCEWFYHPHGSDMDFRPDFPPRERDYLRCQALNAMILLQLHTCTAGYAPTRFQQSQFPAAYSSKIEVIHDGVDTAFWRRLAVERRVGGEVIPPDTRIVTYVSRGFEAMRGFDIFIRAAKIIAASMNNVLFVVVGSDRTCYGGDLRYIKTKTFREHVLRAEKPDLRRFRFLGMVPQMRLREIFSLSDLHIYLTVPFVLSWSPLNALACECVMLGSDTAPMQELIRHEENGLLAGFFDVEGLAAQALRVLKNPAEYRPLGLAGRALIEDQYSVEKTLPKMWDLFTRVRS